MKNYIQTGDVVTVTTPTAIASGGGILVGSLFGIACTKADAGEAVEIAVEGVFNLPKGPDAVFALGDRAAWDATTGLIAQPAVGRCTVGAVLMDAGNGITMVRVRLDGVAVQAA